MPAAITIVFDGGARDGENSQVIIGRASLKQRGYWHSKSGKVEFRETGCDPARRTYQLIDYSETLCCAIMRLRLHAASAAAIS